VRLTRRQLLAAAAPLVLAGCSRPGSSAAPQTFASRGPNAQVPDPQLLLAVPPKSMSPSSVPDFTKRFKVQVAMVAPKPPAELPPGAADVMLVDPETLAALIDQQQVEALDRTLIANRSLLLSPFDDPPFDSGGAHSVPKDYSVVGFALAARAGGSGPSSWADFFDLATTFPGQVVVPDDPAVVIGAALVATGHDWNSTTTTDLDDARSLLLSVRTSIVVEGTVDRGSLDRRLAVLSTGTGFREPGPHVRFVVPPEGTIARPRLLCIPPYAPDPVSAHAWLNHCLDPLTAARDSVRTGRATPVGEAAFALPATLLANPAVYPPALPPVTLGFADTSASGIEARGQVWQDVVAPPTRL
jgi:spermidine/putrescine transport system substrate-binding protein